MRSLRIFHAGAWASALMCLLGGAAAAQAAEAVAQARPAAARADFDAYGRIVLQPGARVLVLGDDLTGEPKDLPGVRFKPSKRAQKAGEPFTVRLQAALGPHVMLISRTRPGQRLDEAASGFDSLPQADAIIMVFGLGDALGGDKPTPPPQFADSLSRLIEKEKAAGIPVVAVAPPPVSDPAVDKGPIEAYRGAVKDRAQIAGESVLVFKPNFRDIHHVWSDGVHLGTPGSRAMASLLAAYFVVAQNAPSR